MIDSKITQKLFNCFPLAFINHLNEFIANPRTNSYFRLEDCETEKDVQIKILHWLSRDCAKAEIRKNHKAYLRNATNEFLETDFTEEDFLLIYGRLGNGVNPELTEKFIDSGFDITVLKD